MYSAYKSLLPNHSADEFAPTLDGATRFDRDEIILRLKSRHIYREGEFEYRRFHPKKFIRRSNLFDASNATRFDCCGVCILARVVRYNEPLVVRLRRGAFSLITPPVVEEHNGKLIVAEGHTRQFESLNSKESEILRDCWPAISRSPLPSDAGEWKEVAVTDEDVDSGAPPDRLEFARRIESLTHPTSDWIARNQ